MAFFILLLGIKQKSLIQHLVPSFLVLKAKPQLGPPVVELTGSRPGQRRRHGRLRIHTVKNRGKIKSMDLMGVTEVKCCDNYSAAIRAHF